MASALSYRMRTAPCCARSRVLPTPSRARLVPRAAAAGVEQKTATAVAEVTVEDWEAFMTAAGDAPVMVDFHAGELLAAHRSSLASATQRGSAGRARRELVSLGTTCVVPR